MFEGHEDFALKLDVIKVIFLLQDALIEDFHGVVTAFPATLVLLGEKDFSEASLAQKTDQTYRAQVDVLAKVFSRGLPARLNHILVQTDALRLTTVCITLIFVVALHRDC